MLADLERLVSAFLRERPELAELVGTPARVYTVLPARAEFPLVLVRRYGGAPVLTGSALVLDAGRMQLDTYGGSKLDAWRLAELVREALAELAGAVRPEGAVGAVRFGAMRYLADPSFSPPRDRYVVDLEIFAKGPALPAAARTTRAADPAARA